jgi:hypothetical protein
MWRRKAKETTLNITEMKLERDFKSLQIRPRELNAEKVFLKKSII